MSKKTVVAAFAAAARKDLDSALRKEGLTLSESEAEALVTALKTKSDSEIWPWLARQFSIKTA